ncbi:hypothetical protein PMAYCL1PPCAC_20536, partial [Pristionchus mayeri]
YRETLRLMSSNATRYEKIMEKERSLGSRVKRAAIGCLLVYLAISGLIISMMMAATIYRPLPSQMGVTLRDRIRGHIFESFTRLFYYYPSRMCPNALCMLHWTRWSMKRLNKLMDPWFDSHPELLMETTTWNGVKVLVYHPRNQTTTDSDGAIVYMHGGGFGMGDIEMFESLTTAMAKQINARLLVSVGYRLAPETTFPGGLEDCEKVLEYVIANGPAKYGVNPNKIIVMGDSAGGNLAASMTQRRKRRGSKPKLFGQVLMYPLLQLSDMQTPSYRLWEREMEGLSFVDPRSVAFYYLWYAGVDMNAHPEYAIAATENRHISEETRRVREKFMNFFLLPAEFQDDTNSTTSLSPIPELSEYLTPFLTNPDFAPLMQPNLTDLPPALIVTIGFDVLRDEGALYAERLKAVGVPTTWTHFGPGFHGMFNLHNRLQGAGEALANLTDWTREFLRKSAE